MKTYFTLLLLLLTTGLSAQTITGKVLSNKGEPVPFASVAISNNSSGTTTDENGTYRLKLKEGRYTVIASSVGFLSSRKVISLAKNETKTIDFTITEAQELLQQVTVTGTRTDKRRTNSAVIVNVINSQTLADVQACNLSEGLKFQTGLRVETDCQTCNYTQLRMNGLAGGYSQILINGRPIFSPLTGLYGLEQVPTNMIERIEVVRGGGSALYGSSAIGGTVNVITKLPKRVSYSVGYTFQSIDGTNDHIIDGNATLVNEEGNAGVSFFFNNRDRSTYDANGDGFSELPELKNTSFGTSLFFLPSEKEKIEVNFSKLNEYRYGGEITDAPAHFALQSEERTHDVYVGNIDYQINFNENNSLITYLATQYTGRDHYTGVRPDVGTPEDVEHLTLPPYGNSKTTTYQGGLQFNHKIENFIKGNNVVTIGTEYVQDDVYDFIEAYSYKVDQTTKNLGVFLQNDWELSTKLSVLAGVRFDNHRLKAWDTEDAEFKEVTNNVFSPRVSLLYKPFENAQLRATWGTGFRAPQAFDTDLHIAFAGGGISRVRLADDLKRERSNSYTVSFNYDKPTEHYIYGFTVESFYTQLNNVFILENIGEDTHGEVFEKRNGDGAVVQGITVEGRLNYDGIIQVDAGFTFQSSKYDTAVENSDALAPKREFLRTPNTYGYATLTYSPNQKFKTALNLVYTGSMEVLHLASPLNLTNDAYFSSPNFTELGVKSSYTFDIDKLKTKLELSGGIKNIFDSYQSSFDVGKDRDSNFVYGPAAPRTYFIGLRFSN